MKKRIWFLLMACLVIFLCSSASSAQDFDADGIEDLRIKKCVSCCTEKKLACYAVNADRRLCEAIYSECFTTCTSRGAMASEWSDCWTAAQ